MTGKMEDRVRQKGQDGANEKDQGIGKDWDTNHILDRLPLEKRLNLMTFIIIIPLAVLVIYLMATVASSVMPIPQSITNITPGQQCHGQPAGGCGLQHVPHCHRNADLPVHP